MKKILLISLLFTKSSCSPFSTSVDYSPIQKSLQANLEDTKSTSSSQLEFLAESYFQANKGFIKRIPFRYRSYLRQVEKKFDKYLALDKPVRYIFVNDRRQFCFSLPNNFIFISSEIMKKSIHSEARLTSIIARELYRLKYKIYRLKLLPPIEKPNLETLIGAARIPLKVSSEVNKHIVNILKDIKLDYMSYLSWVQYLRKNKSLFFHQWDDSYNIFQEEVELKKFIAQNKLNLSTTKKKNPSERFYALKDLF